MNCCKHQWPELFLRQDVSSEPGRSFYKLQMPGPHSSKTYWIGTPRAGSKGSAIDSGCDAAWEPLMQADWTRESLKRSIFSYWKLLGTIGIISATNKGHGLGQLMSCSSIQQILTGILLYVRPLNIYSQTVVACFLHLVTNTTGKPYSKAPHSIYIILAAVDA